MSRFAGRLILCGVLTLMPAASVMAVGEDAPSAGRPAGRANPSATQWATGSEWTFVVADAEGATRSYVVRVTDRPLGNSDRWFELDEVVDPDPSRTSTVTAADRTQPTQASRFRLAAAVDGRHLEVDLAAGIKDVGARLIGELDGDRFRGELRRSNLVDGETILPGVVGWRSGSRPAAPIAVHGWVVGSEWMFVVPGANGQKETFAFRVTGCPYVEAHDCVWARLRGESQPSDYMLLEVLADPRPPLVTYIDRGRGDGAFERLVHPHGVAAAVTGRRLTVNLTTGAKDAGEELVGEIDGDRFRGVRRKLDGLGQSWVETPGVEGWRTR